MNSKSKTTIKFFLYITGGGILGVCLSLGAFRMQDQLIPLISAFYISLQKFSPWISSAICLSALLLSYLPLVRARNRIRTWNNDEDEEDSFYRQIDRLLNFSLGASSLGMIVMFILFPLVTIATLKENCSIYAFSLCTFLFLFSSILLSLIQRKLVEEIRILNPEKQGDALELHFKKKWMNSLDEQERLAVYAASYKAFSCLSAVFFVFFIVLTVAIPFFDVSFLPFLCTGCMWLIPTAVYLKEASRQKSGRMQ